jgi:hypothetical protein
VKNAGGNVLHTDGWTYDVLGRMSRQQSTTGTRGQSLDRSVRWGGLLPQEFGGQELVAWLLT